jgi:3-deoxy-7-phosphoheptulonate synthase
VTERSLKLADRSRHPDGTVVKAGDVRIGGGDLVVIAGPCAVESREQIQRTATEVRAYGAKMLRGGAFKPRTSPYDFQGLGEEGLGLLREAADQAGLPCVTEVVQPSDVQLVERYADMLQVGARNMQNFSLLGALGQCSKPVLLKRSFGSTIQEWLLAAEYLLAAGNFQVVLCERGVRTFDPWVHYALDLTSIPVLREKTHLPVVVDPSHAAGNRRYVGALARAAAAAGADGVMLEVHPQPESAKSDGAQSLSLAEFKALMDQLGVS